LKHKVELKRIGPLNSDGTRNLEFLVNEQTRKVRVLDKAAQAGKVHTRKADLTNTQHVPSPLPGAVEVMYVGVGSDVKKGEPLMLVTAMKMAVSTKILMKFHEGGLLIGYRSKSLHLMTVA
jgi:pyruvate carboxylase